MVPDDFPGAPLLPGNTVDIATIQSQRFYCDKYQTAGRWICSGGKVATVFYYNGKQYCLPFRAIFKPDVLYWLMESAKLQMEDKIESITLGDEWEEWWHMDKKQYHLMHRDEIVCSVLIDPITGTILKASRPSATELLPLGGRIDSAMLRKWWQRRAVPVSQGNIRRILERIGITTHTYLEQNLGLSLTDHYWIKSLDADFGWQDINLFTNDFRDAVGDMQLSGNIEEIPEFSANAFSPSSSAQGDLRKKWIISDGKQFLIKGNHGGNAQESLNEVIASLIHKKQNKQPFVDYAPIQLSQDRPLCCLVGISEKDRPALISPRRLTT